MGCCRCCCSRTETVRPSCRCCSRPHAYSTAVGSPRPWCSRCMYTARRYVYCGCCSRAPVNSTDAGIHQPCVAAVFQHHVEMCATFKHLVDSLQPGTTMRAASCAPYTQRARQFPAVAGWCMTSACLERPPGRIITAILVRSCQWIV